MLFSAGDGLRTWIHPMTGKAGMKEALTTGTNADRKGRWIYKISEDQITDSECTNLTE